MSILENELKRFDNMKEELQKKQKQISEASSNAARLKVLWNYFGDVCISPLNRIGLLGGDVQGSFLLSSLSAEATDVVVFVSGLRTPYRC